MRRESGLFPRGRGPFAGRWGIPAALALLALAASPAAAALPAPVWEPNQPMLAGNQVIATWHPVPGAVRFNLYLDGQKLAESPANQWTGMASEEPGTYHYQVTALDASGAESSPSRPGTITIFSLQPPSTPIFRVNMEERSIQFRWPQPQGAIAFKIYRAESSRGPWTLLGNTLEGAYEDRGLEWCKVYYYSVSSFSAFGKESARGEVVKVRLVPPSDIFYGPPNILHILRTREKERITSLARVEMAGLKGMIPSSEGRYLCYWEDLVLEIDADFKEPLRAWVLPGSPRTIQKSTRVPPPEDLPEKVVLSYAGLVDDRTLLVSDAANNRIRELDLVEGRFKWTSGPLRHPTQEEAPEIWEEHHPRNSLDKPIRLSGCLKLPGGEYWASEETGHTWMVVDAKGKIVRWFVGFNDPERNGCGDPLRVGAASALALLPQGTVFLLTPFNRAGFQVDPHTMRIRNRLGAAVPADVGGFLTFSGWNISPDRKLLTVADASVGTVTLWDLETLSYLGSFGDESGKFDPSGPFRPLARDFFDPGLPILDRGGKRLVLLMASKGYLSVREVVDPLPSPKVTRSGTLFTY